MFKVEVQTVEDYFDFDPLRRADLLALDALLQTSGLPRYFHAGTPLGTPGMRFRMIGYGRTVLDSGLEWPRVGVALQKNYISLYVQQGDRLEPFRGRLGETRMGRGNFSFVRFGDLNRAAVSDLLDSLDKG